MQCTQGFNVIVLSSNAGYYKGTRDEQGFPNCRLTGYFKDEDEAELAEFTRTKEFEITACNEGKGCFGCTK